MQITTKLLDIFKKAERKGPWLRLFWDRAHLCYSFLNKSSKKYLEIESALTFFPVLFRNPYLDLPVLKATLPTSYELCSFGSFAIASLPLLLVLYALIHSNENSEACSISEHSHLASLTHYWCSTRNPSPSPTAHPLPYLANPQLWIT